MTPSCQQSAPRGSSVQRWFRTVRVSVALAMALGMFSTVVQPTAAQVDGNTYTNDVEGLEWAIEWDEDLWESRDSDSFDLILTNGTSFVLFAAMAAYDGDPDSCLDGETDVLLGDPGVDDVEPLEDADGNEIAGGGSDYSYAAYSLVYTPQGGDPEERVNYLECITLVDDESVLLVIHISGLDAYEDDAPDVEDLILSIEYLAEAGTAPSPEPSERATREATAEATTEATREATREVSDDRPEGADEDEGTYLSPTFGYTFEWDADEWTVEDDLTVAEAGRDRLLLAQVEVTSRVYFEGSDEWGDDLDACVDTLVDELIGDPEDGETTFSSGITVSEIELLEDPDTGDIIQGSGDEVAFVAYEYVHESTSGNIQDQVIEVQCHLIDEDAGVVLGVSHISLASAFFSSDRELVHDIVDTVAVPGSSSSGRETPEIEETETPEVETPEVDETAEPSTRGSRSSTTRDPGVDGNAYESPIYGYSYEWDEAVWELVEATSEDDVDTLVLEHVDVNIVVTVLSNQDFGADVEACIEGMEDIISDRSGVRDIAILEGENGPLVSYSSNGMLGLAIYVYSQSGTNMASYTECNAVGDGDTFVIFEASGTSADLAVALPDVTDLAETIILP